MIKFLSVCKLFFVLSLFFPLQLHAVGPYDGIYMISLDSTSYVSVHENSETNQMVVMLVGAEPSNNQWGAAIGTRSENSVTLTSIKGVSDLDTASKVKVVFNSDGSATVTILSCVDGALYYCGLPAGVTVSAYRIF
jgi:hypothetical protein